jgi:hypothetical protein
MNDLNLSRREMLTRCSAVGLAVMCLNTKASEVSATAPNVRVITHGPKHHWFGYYDKFEFDPTDRYVLGMEVDFEHRSPKPTDEIRIGMVDLQDNDRWIDLGSTTAWCWQQGCMLQWIPGSASEVIWNGREADHYVSHVLDVKTHRQRTIPHPIYALSPDGKTALTIDFRRIADVRPGYGYVGFPDPFADDLAPKDTGIFRIDLETGKSELIISIADVVRLGTILNPAPGIKHHMYHLLFNPDGSRFAFLHRWLYPNGKRLSRLFTAKPDGTDLHILDENGLASHFIWRDKSHILSWASRPSDGPALYLFKDETSNAQVVAKNVITADGHCNYLPGGEWIVDDTYPNADRLQEVFLYNPTTSRRISLGSFPSPAPYTGEWRCDTHPRISRDGRMLVIDSPHEREGRQLHLIDLREVLE